METGESWEALGVGLGLLHESKISEGLRTRRLCATSVDESELLGIRDRRSEEICGHWTGTRNWSESELSGGWVTLELWTQLGLGG